MDNRVCMGIKRRLTFGKIPFKNIKLQDKEIFWQNLEDQLADDRDGGGEGCRVGDFSPKKILVREICLI